MSTPVPVVRFTLTDLGSGDEGMISVSHKKIPASRFGRQRESGVTDDRDRREPEEIDSVRARSVMGTQHPATVANAGSNPVGSTLLMSAGSVGANAGISSRSEW